LTQIDEIQLTVAGIELTMSGRMCTVGSREPSLEDSGAMRWVSDQAYFEIDGGCYYNSVTGETGEVPEGLYVLNGHGFHQLPDL
jgi:hypothetical protein